MKIYSLVVLSLFGLAGAVVCAHAQSDGQAPAAQLSFYVGQWSESGQSRADPSQAYGNLSGQESCDWHSGRLAVVCRESTKDKAGNVDSIYILAYDTARKVYTVNGVDNAGTVLSGSGNIDHGQWLWHVEAAAKGAMTRMRFTFNPEDKAARRMKVEVAATGDSWAELSSVLYTSRK
jgi:hypothetical protein